MKESSIEAAFVKWCKAHGYYTRKFSSPAHRGVPDRIVAKNGKVLFIEFKAPGKVPTTLQRRELTELRDHGLKAAWADSLHVAVSCCEVHLGV